MLKLTLEKNNFTGIVSLSVKDEQCGRVASAKQWLKYLWQVVEAWRSHPVLVSGSVRKLLEDAVDPNCQGIIKILTCPWVSLFLPCWEESLLFVTILTDWGSDTLVLFQATISGPAVKNNSLHENILLVKGDAATNVWMFQWRRESQLAFPHVWVCYTFTILSCLHLLFPDDPLEYADSCNLSLNHPFHEHPFVLDLQRHPVVATNLQLVSHDDCWLSYRFTATHL